MQIIGGKFKGTNILEIKSKDRDSVNVHPMGSRVRNALFNSLSESIQGRKILDLYAGTGAIGLEALSRGAERVDFVEQDKKVMEKVLKKNIDKVMERYDSAGVRVYLSDVEEFVDEMIDDIKDDCLECALSGAMRKYDIIIADPPYKKYNEKGFAERLLLKLAKIVSMNGVIILSAPMELEFENRPKIDVPELQPEVIGVVEKGFLLEGKKKRFAGAVLNYFIFL